MSKPITPQEVASAKIAHIPPIVFDTFNAEIAKHFVDGEATVNQRDVVKQLVAAGMTHDDIDASGCLNIEEAYRAAGWTVTYDKPGFNETGDALFKFKSRRNK